ncbi:MAG: 4'-phosphopantetheinyl transferase family protein [Reyranella sp.]
MVDQVVVWSWRLELEPLSFEAAEALLSDDEKARGLRFVTAALRHRFVAGRARLRSLLGAHLGLDPHALVFAENAFGKPRLADRPSVHFSLSHSGDQAVLAVSEQREIGIDIERVRPLDHLDLARRYFHPNEVAAIGGVKASDEQLLAFFRIWTLKEATAKAIGKGLSIPLDSFEVSIATSPPTMVVAPEGAPLRWWLHQTVGDYCFALAVPGGGEVGLIQRTV